MPSSFSFPKGYYQITYTIDHTNQVVVNHILDGEWIETTLEHPFYMEGKGWVNAEDLQTGDQVHQADGTTGTVWLKWNVQKTQEMYNLYVDTAHTFFVGDGQWLVHNCGGQNKLYTVYRSVKDNVTEYVGITTDFARRKAEHFNAGRIVDEIPGLQNLSKFDARSIEQTLINKFKFKDLGDALSNINNSISPRRVQYYNRALNRGKELLDTIVPIWSKWK